MMGKLDEYEAIQRQIDEAKASGAAVAPAAPKPRQEPPPPPPPPGPAGGCGSATSAASASGATRDGHRSSAQPPAGKTVEVVVPESAVGALIGKGGATIDALQKESGCRVRIPKEGGDGGGGLGYSGRVGADERVVLLTGNDEQLAHAQSLIEDKLSAHHERQANMGGKQLKQQMRSASARRPSRWSSTRSGQSLTRRRAS